MILSIRPRPRLRASATPFASCAPSLRPALAGWLVLLALSPPAQAEGNVTLRPVTPEGADYTELIDGGTVFDFNPSRTSVDTLAGFRSVTSLNFDSAAAVARGYVAYSLPEARTYSSVDAAGGASVAAAFVLDTELISAEDIPPTGPAELSFEMAFDGRFANDSGQPTLLLGGNLAITSLDTELPITGQLYQSQILFTSTALNDATTPVTVLTQGTASALLGGEDREFDGARFDILGATPDRLDAVLRLTVPIELGQRLILTGALIAAAGPQPDPQSGESDPTASFSVLAAAGAVDFSNTARFRIYLPDGYALSGDDPALQRIVFSTPVPEVDRAWLLAVGLVLVVARGQHRARHLERLRCSA